jgi:taurine dioxygenase
MAIYGRGADCFHTDGAYDEDPFKATQLYALALPSRGGDTHFASMYAAYDALPPRLKDKLAGKRGAFRYGGRTGRVQLLNEADRHEPNVYHPILRVHPETGRTCLYFDPGKILAIEGFEEAESDEIIDELETYAFTGGYRSRSTAARSSRTERRRVQGPSAEDGVDG